MLLHQQACSYWDSNTLAAIVNIGTKFYHDLCINRHLTINYLPKYVTICGVKVKVNLHAKNTGVMICDSTFPHIHFQDNCIKYISKCSTYNIHLLAQMTSCFFCSVSIPTLTNICEAVKVKFEYIIYYELLPSRYCKFFFL